MRLKTDVLLALLGGKPGRTPFWGDGSFVMGDWPGRKPPRSGVDAWGVTWAPLPDDYVPGSDEPSESFPVEHPAGDPRDILAIPLPEFALPEPFANSHQLVIGQHPAGPLDRFMTLLGPRHAYLALAEQAADSGAALLHIAEHHVQVARGLLAAGADAGFLADDYAGQDGPLISPKMWQSLVLPAVQAVLGVYRMAGAPVIFHTCGAAGPFIGPLLDAGATAFNLQSDICDLPALRRRYGPRIAFYGGVPSDIMLRGGPAPVRSAVRQALDTLGTDGGLVLAPDQPLAYSAANTEAFAREASKSNL